MKPTQTGRSGVVSAAWLGADKRTRLERTIDEQRRRVARAESSLHAAEKIALKAREALTHERRLLVAIEGQMEGAGGA